MSIDEVEERYRAPALDKGLDILELLAETDEGLSQAEIAKALNRSPNEIYRMLDRLVRRGYIARTTTDRYELTLKLFALAHRHAPMRRLVSQFNVYRWAGRMLVDAAGLRRRERMYGRLATSNGGPQ